MDLGRIKPPLTPISIYIWGRMLRWFTPINTSRVHLDDWELSGPLQEGPGLTLLPAEAQRPQRLQ